MPERENRGQTAPKRHILAIIPNRGNGQFVSVPRWCPGFSRPSILVVGCWFLVLGSWFLVVGCWLLVVGCWLLGVERGAGGEERGARE